MEIELKLLLDAASRSTVESHPAFAAAAAQAETRQETTTYFDTPDLTLRQRGASLRVRHAVSRFVQTVKLDASGATIGARGEWEWDVASASPDLAKLNALPEEAAFVREAAERVGPVFKTEIERTAWQLALGQGTEVEAVIDQGSVEADSRRAPIFEVELELKAGSPAPLFELAIELAERAGLRYGPQSKAERGYRLVSSEAAPKRRTEDLDLDRKVTIGEAVPLLINTAVRELAAEIPGAASRNVEAVHRMRAAIRKLRTLLVLFAPYLDRAAAQRFNAVLREFGRVLGAGRDWDVFLTETLPKAEASMEPAGLGLLRGPAEALSAEAHARVGDAVESPRLTGLILGLGAWTADAGWLHEAEPDALLRDLLPQLLTRLEKRVRKRARHLDGHAAHALHDLRKALKKLRYGVEDVEPLFKHKRVGHYLKSIKDILAVLGDINDAAVTVERAFEVAPPERPEFAPAVAALLRWNDDRRGKAIRKLDRKLHKFLGATPFWV